MYPPSSRSSHRSKSVAEPPSYETVDSPRPRSKNLPPPPTHQERTHAPSSRQSERSHAPSSRSSQTPPLGHHARHRSEVPPSKDVRRDRDRDGKRDSERESRKFVDGLEEELTCPICMGVM
jgi:hypothetical protein